MSYSLSIKFIPSGEGKEEVYGQVDNILQTIINSGLVYRVGPSETTILGTFDELHMMLKKINETALHSGYNSFMILANFTCSTYEQDMDEKTTKYEH